MADIKNTARSKRKYADREGKTAANKTARTARHEKRTQRMKDRTLALIGSPVKVAKQDATVKAVLFSGDEDYPKRSRSGAYLRVDIDGTERIVARRSVKPVPAIV